MQTEPTTQTEPVPPSGEAAPLNWQEILRQHTTGPVFSLAVHILILVVLGTLVVIVPNTTTDDAETVQLTEQEPVVPPPEEEPIPSDMTVLDSSSPSLDRYESNNQQMEDVGVTDLEIMTDVDIASPLIIPNSNSALKLQGALPFGRPGGGKMGDGRDGDGRGNTEGMLQGVFYDLKQTRDRRATEVAQDTNRLLPILKQFVLGSWTRQYDKNGDVHYTFFDKYYCSPTRLWNSLVYILPLSANRAPEAFQCEKEVDGKGWVCIYSGNVVAPFTGKFRFIGSGDDIIVVRFNKEIVLDYGWHSATIGSYLGNGPDDDLRKSMRGEIQNERFKRMIAESPLYSKHKLSVYSQWSDHNHGLAKSPVLQVVEGQVCSIEILITEFPGIWFNAVLFMEQLDENDQPINEDHEIYTLFRTTLALPAKTDLTLKDQENQLPKYKPYGPIWRVVSSTDSDGGAAVKSGKLPQSVLNKRNEARTSAVSEDDDDLTL